MKKRWLRFGSSALAVCLLPGSALAHTAAGAATGFAAGFAHPLGGADHLLAMVAVGLWAAQLGGRALWMVPVTFVAVMLAGAALGMSGVSLPFVEAGILASVLVMGVLVAAALRLQPAVGALLVAVFALFHGHAHGTEMPLVAGGLAWGAGFALCTALLHATGMGLALALRRFSLQKAVRLAGGAIAVGGLYLSLT